VIFIYLLTLLLAMRRLLFFSVLILTHCTGPPVVEPPMLRRSPLPKQPMKTKEPSLKEQPLPEDLVWTDPDNPNQILEINALKEGVEKPWLEDLLAAQRLSYVKAQPLLLWFTNPKENTPSESLAQEVFETSWFKTWSPKNLVKLRISPKHPDYRSLKKRFHLMGHPIVLLISPDHSVLARYSGFQKGKGASYQIKLQRIIEASEDKCDAWKHSMQNKGYRVFTGKNGKQIFGKMLSYTKERLLIVEPNGRETVTNISYLSPPDKKSLLEIK